MTKNIIWKCISALGVTKGIFLEISNAWHVFKRYNMCAVYVCRFEDHAALDGGKDGLKVIKQILTVAPQILTNHG